MYNYNDPAYSDTIVALSNGRKIHCHTAIIRAICGRTPPKLWAFPTHSDLAVEQTFKIMYGTNPEFTCFDQVKEVCYFAHYIGASAIIAWLMHTGCTSMKIPMRKLLEIACKTDEPTIYRRITELFLATFDTPKQFIAACRIMSSAPPVVKTRIRDEMFACTDRHIFILKFDVATRDIEEVPFLSPAIDFGTFTYADCNDARALVKGIPILDSILGLVMQAMRFA